MEELDEPKEPKLLLLPPELEEDDELLELELDELELELEREELDELDLASEMIGLNARARVTRATLSSEVRDVVIEKSF